MIPTHIFKLSRQPQYYAFLSTIQLVINNSRMRSSLMRPPAISEIFNQKLTYENHLKKLELIREQRKNQLHFDHNRLSHLQQIKNGKSRTFANKFNEQNDQINQSNIKLLSKLEKTKPFARYTSYSSRDRPLRDQPGINPVVRRQIIETEKENSRIFFKMKSMSSTLNKDRMLDDYAKAQKIKQRITKYAKQNNKISLKSEKYFSQNKSVLSSRSLDPRKVQKIKSNLVSHYNKEDIIRNRIESNVRSFKKYKQNRGLPSLNPKQSQDKSEYVEDKAFFTTEPAKNKRSMTTRNKKV